MTNKAVYEYNLEGLHLIEASAGTGKTYTIMNLYLRFILEKELSVDQLLVVTFTEAATKELKDRIRQNLQATSNWLDKINSLSDLPSGKLEVNEIIAKKFLEGQEDFESALKLARINLRRAVVSFDEAAIFTIHGFCKRMLDENAFESGALFDMELISDQNELLDLVVNDFWRQKLYGASKDEVELIKESKLSRDNLKAMAKEFLKNPKLKLLSGEKGKYTYKDLSKAKETATGAVKEIFDEVNKWVEWLRDEKNVRELTKVLLKDMLFKSPLHKEDSVTKTINGISDRLLKFPTKVFTNSYPFTNDLLKSKLKDSSMSLPSHPFWGFCESISNESSNRKLVDEWAKKEKKVIKKQNKALKEIEDNILTQEIKKEFLEYFPEVFEQRKQQLNVMTYDDLLLNLEKALESKGGGDFIKLVRDRFKVAMIDEFQDTDPVQYNIFSKFFGEDSTFFMIGDPKQSIYKFRGADITAYLEAKKKVTDEENIHTLDTNYRSTESMIDAANLFFQPQPNFDTFVSEEIKYETVKTGGGKPRLMKEGEEVSVGLKMNWIKTLDGKKITSGLANYRTTMSVCDEIVELVNGSYSFCDDEGNSELVKPGDIAILVTAHRQSRTLQKELAKRGIPSVLQNSGNLFESDEAKALVRVLTAVISQSDFDIRPALVSCLFNLDAEAILALTDEDYMDWYKLFVTCRNIWLEKGFMAMFSHLSQVKLEVKDSKSVVPSYNKEGEGLRARSIKVAGGERVLTNLLHLSEALHSVEQREGFGPEGLLSWFVRKLDDSSKNAEEYLQRLESDSAAVKLLTVHASKGLEFPITFCPFMWNKKFKGSAQKDFTFHDDEGNNCYEIGSDNVLENLEINKKESLQEAMRLLYVAVTRSRNCCYLHWGPFNQSESSALMYWVQQQFDDFNLPGYVREGKGSLTFGDKSIEPSEKVIEKFNEVSKKMIDKSNDYCLAENPVLELKVVETSTKAKAKKLEDDGQEDAPLKAKVFSGLVKSGWGVGSFSSLTRFASHGHTKTAVIDEVKDMDAQDEPEVEIKTSGVPKAFIDLRGGATLGTAVHEIFEEIDFTKLDQSDLPAKDLAKVVEQRLKRYALIYGSDEETRQADLELKQKLIVKMVRDTISREIDLQKNGSVCLETIAEDKRLVEMNFFFRLKSISNQKLVDIFARKGHGEIANDFAEKLGKLNFDLLKGYMNGAIDLTFEHEDKFYILDWKTTSCGKSLADYTATALKESMFDHHYILQYHIYVAALHLYLKKRVPGYTYETHFGGAIYAYVRGVNADNNNGFFYDCPPKALIEAICKELIGEEN